MPALPTDSTMYASYDQIHRAPRNTISVPLIWVMIVLSLLVHLAALYEFFPKMQPISLSGPDKQGISPLAVMLAARPGPRAPAAAVPETTPPPVVVRPPARPSRPAPTPLPIVPRTPNPDALRLPPPPVAAAPPSPPPMRVPAETDMAAYIAARRRERGEPEPSGSQGAAPNAPVVEDEKTRRDRIVAENLAAVRTPTFGGEPRNGGGVFQLRQIGLNDAQFTFFGWNIETKRRVNQRIDVERGNNPDIRIAIVRKIITIIRAQESGTFKWQSLRLGRDVNLSAKPEDTTELEAFIMREFFDSDLAPR